MKTDIALRLNHTRWAITRFSESKEDKISLAENDKDEMVDSLAIKH